MSYKLLAGSTITKDKSGDITITIDKPLVSVSHKNWKNPDEMGKDIYGAVSKTLTELYKEVKDFAEEETHPKDKVLGASDLLLPTGKEDANHNEIYKIKPHEGNSHHSKLEKAIGKDGQLKMHERIKAAVNGTQQGNGESNGVATKDNKTLATKNAKPEKQPAPKPEGVKQNIQDKENVDDVNSIYQDDNTDEGGFGAYDKQHLRRFIFEPEADNGANAGNAANANQTTQQTQAQKPETEKKKKVNNLKKQTIAKINTAKAPVKQTDKKQAAKTTLKATTKKKADKRADAKKAQKKVTKSSAKPAGSKSREKTQAKNMDERKDETNMQDMVKKSNKLAYANSQPFGESTASTSSYDAINTISIYDQGNYIAPKPEAPLPYPKFVGVFQLPLPPMPPSFLSPLTFKPPETYYGPYYIMDEETPAQILERQNDHISSTYVYQPIYHERRLESGETISALQMAHLLFPRHDEYLTVSVGVALGTKGYELSGETGFGKPGDAEGIKVGIGYGGASGSATVYHGSSQGNDMNVKDLGESKTGIDFQFLAFETTKTRKECTQTMYIKDYVTGNYLAVPYQSVFTEEKTFTAVGIPTARGVKETRKVYIDRYGEIENYLLISQYREGVELGKKAEKSITENIKIGGEITISFDTMWFDDEIPKQEQPHYEIRFGGY